MVSALAMHCPDPTTIQPALLLLAAQCSMDTPGSTVGIGNHSLGVYPYELSPFLEDPPIHKDPLDVARLGVEDHLAQIIEAWREVKGLRIEYDDVGLFAWCQRADLVRHVENL